MFEGEITLMKKVLKIVILSFILLQLLYLSSCAMGDKGNNSKIQIWHYHNSNMDLDIPDRIIKLTKDFCDTNHIPLEINIVDQKSVSIDNYILKRNIALSTGNAIIIDDQMYLEGIAKKHADYTRFDSYNKLLDAHKGRYCIPLGLNYKMFVINKDILKHYGVDILEKSVITYADYLNAKQEMKEKGANFKFNTREYYEIIHYNMNSNKLAFIDIENEILDDKEFEKKLKNTILSICNEFKTKEYSQIDLNKRFYSSRLEKMLMYDETSELALDEYSYLIPGGLLDPYKYDMLLEGIKIPDKIFVVDPYSMLYSPSVYVHNKITNKKIYDVVDYIVSDSSYIIMNEGSRYSKYAPTFVPTLDTKNTKYSLYLNDDWEFVGSEGRTKISEVRKKLVDSVFEIFAKNKEKSKEVADYYFYYNEGDGGCNKIIEFIVTTINDIAKKLSTDTITLEKYDSNNLEINKFIDDEIDKFIYEFKLYNQ